MLFHKLTLIITFAVSYTEHNRIKSGFVKIEHYLNEEHTHELIENRKVPERVKKHIEAQALRELATNNIYPVNILTMRVIKKEVLTYDTDRTEIPRTATQAQSRRDCTYQMDNPAC